MLLYWNSLQMMANFIDSPKMVRRLEARIAGLKAKNIKIAADP
jgi:hypothetical protein